MSDFIRTDEGDGIVRVTLNRGPVNALSANFLMDFSALIDGLATDDTVRAVVIDSSFKVFSAGLDLKEAQAFDDAAQSAIVDGLNVGFLSLFCCPKPVVAAVNGAAIAGGLFFVLAADFRVAVPKAKFGLAEVRVGVDFPVGPMEIARATLSPNDLRRLMLSGQPIDAERALTSGIVDQIVEPDRLIPEAVSAAAMLAQSPPNAYASVKRQIRGAVIEKIERAMAHPTGRGWFTEETKQAMGKMIG